MTAPMTTAAPAPWHTLAVEAVASALGTDRSQGLSPDEAASRLASAGPNVIAEARRRGPWRILLEQFTDVMVLVLIGAAVVASVVGELQDTVAIVAIVVLNAALGFVQEYRAEQAVAALKALAAAQALVRRGGVTRAVPGADLVPGDLVLLEAGALVPADLRLMEARGLKAEEAALTGESQPVDKLVEPLGDPALPVGDRSNMAFKGTVVTHGRGTAIVIATGMQTELGRIATLLREEVETHTPLQRRLARFARALAAGTIALCAVIFAVGLLRGEDPMLMFLTALSLAVAAIPEALPAVVTVSLAIGARRMVAHQALIRRLPAVETLGSVTFICSDKTGTLTENRMRVVSLATPARGVHDLATIAHGGPAERVLLQAMALSNDAEARPDGSVHGDPTEVALYEAAARAGVVKETLAGQMTRVGEIPFSAERGRMTTLHRDRGGAIAFTKGAPEQVLLACESQLTDDGETPLDHGAATAMADAMAADGLRVLALAYRSFEDLPAHEGLEAEERGLTLVGLVGLLDPPRPEAREAVEQCRAAGISVVMITGDHPATAQAVARELGIVAREGGPVLTGRDLAQLSGEEVRQTVERTRVYARAAPEQKITIVRALQERGEFVAMTGDGVNDAPALRRADIGVAMGRVGTDVAREAADMVLLDDNFATIVAAIRVGRRIFDNIRKFIRYVLTGNSAEIWTLFLAPFLGLPLPLLPIHILWINLVTDGLPGVALAVEPEEEDVMRRPPRPPDESIFAHGLWQHVVWVGLLMAGVTLATQAWAYRTGSAHWQSMTFTVLALSQLGQLLAIRSERASLLRQGILSNRPLLGTVVLTVLLQMATLYVPMLRGIFHTSPLSAAELALCLGLSSVVFVAVEIEKWMRRRGWIFRGGPVRRLA